MTEDEVTAHIRKLVAEAPPLSEDARARLKAIFAPAVRRLADRDAPRQPATSRRFKHPLQDAA